LSTINAHQLPKAQESLADYVNRQRSLLTKQRTRLTRLRTRILRQAPLFFFEQLQEKLAENPEYYGVCIIEGICRINPRQRLGWLAQQKAIARENELRGHSAITLSETIPFNFLP
jgi:hypothetical protein